MRVKYPALKAELDSHTVATKHGFFAGFLVRCSASRTEMGYVWSAGSAWRWRTADGQNTGERSSQQAAVRVLRDAYDLRRQPSLLDTEKTFARPATVREIQDAWRAPIIRPTRAAPPRLVKRPPFVLPPSSLEPKPTPKQRAAIREVVKAMAPEPEEAPVEKIDRSKHASSGDVTAALAAALEKKR